MKRIAFLSCIAGVALFAVFSQGCKKEKHALVTTAAVTEITKNSATAGGNVTSEGGSAVTARGVCYSISPNPTVSNFITEAGSGTGAFTVSITHLSFNTTYFLRAYATNEAGTAYGEPVVFTTLNSGFFIGQAYGGGLIFYLDYTGEHGLICAATNQDKVFWSNENRVTGATDFVIGTGLTNTGKIVNTMGPLGIQSAAQICEELVLNGYDDWFLPSKDELSAMYDNLAVQGLGDFEWNTYWSSTESLVNGLTNAWCQNFRVGEHDDWSKNTNTYHVRAVRAF